MVRQAEREATTGSGDTCLNCKFIVMTDVSKHSPSGVCTRFPQSVDKRGKNLFMKCGEHIVGKQNALVSKENEVIEKPEFRGDMSILDAQ